MTRELAPGVRLHLLSTDRFATTTCHVLLHRRVEDQPAATAVLAKVLDSATRRQPTRVALSHRLADLYGAGLHVGVRRLGQRGALMASLTWPTRHVPRAKAQLGRGLALLRDVLTDPVRAQLQSGASALDEGLVATQVRNHERALRAARDDKAQYALRAAIQLAAPEEPLGQPLGGTLEDLEGVTPEGLAALHARLIREHPVDIYLAGAVGLAEARTIVAKHLLWPERATRVRGLGRVPGVRAARAKPRRKTERDDITQAQIVEIRRGAIRPSTSAAHAAQVFSGVLGEGGTARLFRVLREEHGLCYHIGSRYHRPHGLLVVHTGLDEASVPKASRLIRKVVADVSAGRFPEETLTGYREGVIDRVRAIADDPDAMLGWWASRDALGIDEGPAELGEALTSVSRSAITRVAKRLALDATFHMRPTHRPETESA